MIFALLMGRREVKRHELGKVAAQGIFPWTVIHCLHPDVSDVKRIRLGGAEQVKVSLTKLAAPIPGFGGQITVDMIRHRFSLSSSEGR